MTLVLDGFYINGRVENCSGPSHETLGPSVHDSLECALDQSAGLTSVPSFVMLCGTST